MIHQRAENPLPHRGALWHPHDAMDPHAKLAAAQALLGITLLAFLPILLVTLLNPLRHSTTRRR